MHRRTIQDHIEAITKKASRDREFCFKALGVALSSHMEDEDLENFIEDLQARTLYQPKVIDLPKYVSLGKTRHHKGSELRLEDDRYHRDAGAWDVGFKEVEGVLYATSSHAHLDGQELVPITKEEWAHGNRGYV